MATDVSPGSSSKPGWNYVITNSIKEDCRTPVWCICFNNIDPNHKDIFASCCGTQVTVYKLQTAGGIELIQAYVDAWEDEEFFACKFTLDERNGAPLLMAAGKCGILKVLDCHNGALHWAAEGHGDAINDIAVHARKPSIVVTASRDQSLRLWNVLSKVCLLVIGGSDGHRNEVLSVDFHPFQGHRLASSGMDSMVKVWDLSDWASEMDESYKFNSEETGLVWHSGRHSITVFSTDQAHSNYVDCVRLLDDDLVLSKSVNNQIALWRPHRRSADASSERGLIDLIAVFSDGTFSRMACGTNIGNVLVFDLQQPGNPQAMLARPPGQVGVSTTVRQTALSRDGKTLLACCEDTTIWRWDLDGVPMSGSMGVRHRIGSAGRGRGRARGRSLDGNSTSSSLESPKNKLTPTGRGRGRPRGRQPGRRGRSRGVYT